MRSLSPCLRTRHGFSKSVGGPFKIVRPSRVVREIDYNAGVVESQERLVTLDGDIGRLKSFTRFDDVIHRC